VRAHRDAARTISTLFRSVADLVEQSEDLADLPGVGEDLARKSKETVRTDHSKQLEEIRQRTPGELAQMLNVSGLGPKRVQTIHRELGASTTEGLMEAGPDGQIRDLHGLGEKTEQEILKELEEWSYEGKQAPGRGV
jgi:DNA polymerase (family 10)